MGLTIHLLSEDLVLGLLSYFWVGRRGERLIDEVCRYSRRSLLDELPRQSSSHLPCYRLIPFTNALQTNSLDHTIGANCSRTGLGPRELLRSLFSFLSRSVGLHFNFLPCKLFTPPYTSRSSRSPNSDGTYRRHSDAYVSKGIQRSVVRALYMLTYLDLGMCDIYIILMGLSY